VLGVWTDGQGAVQHKAFPHWATIPSSYDLAAARIWHLAFAWVLALGLLLYLLWSLLNGHLRRDIHITRREWAPAHIWHDVKQHARLRFPTGAAALRYNVLQKIAYAGVLFGLLPLVIVTGLAMSPGMDAAWPILTEIWGGRQSARSLHFLAAFGLVGFVVVHLVMVLLAGPINEVRSMITGWYRLPKDKAQ
jgi:thiosulfate reductase cytochrome b subunit